MEGECPRLPVEARVLSLDWLPSMSGGGGGGGNCSTGPVRTPLSDWLLKLCERWLAWLPLWSLEAVLVQESSEGCLAVPRLWPGLTGMLGGRRVPPGPRNMSPISGVVAYGSGDRHMRSTCPPNDTSLSPSGSS